MSEAGGEKEEEGLIQRASFLYFGREGMEKSEVPPGTREGVFLFAYEEGG